MSQQIKLIGKQKVDATQIIYIRAVANYSEVFLTCGKKVLLSKTLKTIEKMLMGYNFFRPHKSFLINLGHVINTRIRYSNKIYLSNNYEVEISRRKKIDFLNLY